MGSLWSKSLDSLCSKSSLCSCCSKSSNYEGVHVVLSDATNGTNAGGSRALDPSQRELALAAAERRAKEAESRGVHGGNPKRGELSKKLANQNRGIEPEPQPIERLIYD